MTLNSDILGGDSGNGNGAAISTASPPSEAESRSGLPGSFKELGAKRRGVKPGTIRGHYKKSPEPPAPTKPAPAPSNLFTPENVRPLVSLPFDLALVKTGFTGFALTPSEAATLSATGSVALNQWVTIDPRYVAVLLFSLSLISITSQKVVLYQNHVRKMVADAKEAAANGGEPQ